MRSRPSPSGDSGPRTGIARALSKLGVCSRSQGVEWVRQGRVSVDGRRVLDPETPTRPGRSRIEVDGRPVGATRRIYVLLNKPRGLVTTASDEKGRATVFQCLTGLEVGHLFPVGRLDQASEGLLLFTNDTRWAENLTSPESHVDKRYHVQVGAGLEPDRCAGLARAGSGAGEEGVGAKSVRFLRSGGRTTWLEVTLDEGRNRQIRRLMESHGLEVQRLIRVAVGSLELGDLPKGAWRHLAPEEVRGLGPSGTT